MRKLCKVYVNIGKFYFDFLFLHVIFGGFHLLDVKKSTDLIYQRIHRNPPIHSITAFFAAPAELLQETEDKRGSRYSAEASRDRSVFSIHAESQVPVGEWQSVQWEGLKMMPNRVAKFGKDFGTRVFCLGGKCVIFSKNECRFTYIYIYICGTSIDFF